jgi:hypothetical protein
LLCECFEDQVSFGVESGDFIDSEGNIVSVDSDFSLTVEVHDLVKQDLKIEMKKIETDVDNKDKEKFDRAFITRFEREERLFIVYYEEIK